MYGEYAGCQQDFNMAVMAQPGVSGVCGHGTSRRSPFGSSKLLLPQPKVTTAMQWKWDSVDSRCQTLNRHQRYPCGSHITVGHHLKGADSHDKFSNLKNKVTPDVPAGAAASAGDPSTPLGKAVRILNNQLQALTSIDEHTDALDARLEKLSTGLTNGAN